MIRRAKGVPKAKPKESRRSLWVPSVIGGVFGLAAVVLGYVLSADPDRRQPPPDQNADTVAESRSANAASEEVHRSTFAIDGYHDRQLVSEIEGLSGLSFDPLSENNRVAISHSARLLPTSYTDQFYLPRGHLVITVDGFSCSMDSLLTMKNTDPTGHDSVVVHQMRNNLVAGLVTENRKYIAEQVSKCLR